PAGVQRAVPPRGRPGSARLALPVRALPRADREAPQRRRSDRRDGGRALARAAPLERFRGRLGIVRRPAAAGCPSARGAVRGVEEEAMLAPVLAACAALASDPPGPGDASMPKTLAERCGSQIEWMVDGWTQDDGGAAFKYVARGKPLDDEGERKLIDDALAKAKEQKRLVLWYAFRIEGPQMYRAPNLDDYMDEVPWSDPDVVALVRDRFGPLRTRVSAATGKDFRVVPVSNAGPPR